MASVEQHRKLICTTHRKVIRNARSDRICSDRTLSTSLRWSSFVSRFQNLSVSGRSDSLLIPDREIKRDRENQPVTSPERRSARNLRHREQRPLSNLESSSSHDRRPCILPPSPLVYHEVSSNAEITSSSVEGLCCDMAI